jgi:hypothetical protein
VGDWFSLNSGKVSLSIVTGANHIIVMLYLLVRVLRRTISSISFGIVESMIEV